MQVDEAVLRDYIEISTYHQEVSRIKLRDYSLFYQNLNPNDKTVIYKKI